MKANGTSSCGTSQVAYGAEVHLLPRRLSLLLGALLASLGLLVATASSASALYLGLQWTGNYQQAETEMSVVGKSGADLFRLPIVPANTNNGASWVYYDTVFGRAAERGVTILPQFGGRFNGGLGLPSKTENNGQGITWEEWAKQAVRRYGYNGIYWSQNPGIPAKPVIAWEMWNEPNNASMNGGNPILASEYGDFLAWAGSAVQTASQSWGGHTTGVLFGGLLAWGAGTNYQTYLKNAYNVPGASSAMTGLAFHPYELEPSSFPNESRIQAFQNSVSEARKFLNSLSGGGNKSLWITETGWPVAYDFAVSENEQANLLRESIDWSKARLASFKLETYIWYNYRDISEPRWQYRCGLRTENGYYRPAWYAYQEETGAPLWPEPRYVAAFPASTGSLITVGKAANMDWQQEIMPGTNPSVTALSNGGYEMAFQNTSGLLVSTGTAGYTNWGQGMKAGTSPSITALPGGGYEMAFQANTGNLISIGTAGGVNWGQGMKAGTSPSITALSTGGYQMAFQANTGNLISIGTAGGINWGLGLMAGTSPSITALSNGGYEMAFQVNTGQLWSTGTDAHGNWGYGMAPGTSPSITALSNGGYEMAFQANTGKLWSVGSDQHGDWGYGMAPGTSPSITALPGGGYEMAFQANTGKLWSVGSQQHGDWGQSMPSGTSPSISSGEWADTFRPKATTEAATDVSAGVATLYGTVNPNAAQTTYQFEYGKTISYGTKVPASPKEVGSGESDIKVNQEINGLEPGTEYHFRIAATNAVGTSYGKDETFKTAPDTGSELAAMAVTEPFDGSSESLARFSSDWSTLGWASGSTPKGSNTTSGWRPVNAYPTLNGAFFNPTITDTGPGIAVVATMAANPGLESRHFSLWLDMPTPAGAKAGYELRFTDVSSNTYGVKLSKWSGGTETELASKSGYTFENGDSLALVDEGGTVSAWTDTGSGFEQLLSGSDAAFKGGNAGLSGAGNYTRLADFRVGALLNPVASMDAALRALPVNDPFTTNESPLSGGGAWAALAWDNSTSGHNTGRVSGGWGPYDAYPTINGAYWQKASFADTGAGDAVAATLYGNPTIASRYFSVWLNAANPASARSGYELRFTETSSGVYEVTLSRWQSGVKTVLASKSGYSFPTGSQFALVDKAGTVSAWTNTGSEYTQIISAVDATFFNGYTGIEGSGNITRLKDFRSGPLAPF